MDKIEINRIEEAYERRKERIPPGFYSFFNCASLFAIQEKERAILDALKRNGINSLETKRILDIGCGSGVELRNLTRYGATPEYLYGIDLLAERIKRAENINPNINFKCLDASSLPFESSSFDLVMQFTVFTSILDSSMKRKIAEEMLRVLKKGGLIIWYDYHMNNPKNQDVRGVKKREIYELFPECRISLKRITLAPPINRLIAPHSWAVCYLLGQLKFLNTHYLGVVEKRG